MKKEKFPGFEQCMAMMRHRDALTQEHGFHGLFSHAGKYVHELIEEFDKEENRSSRRWLVELIGSAKSADAFEFLVSSLKDRDQGVRGWAIWGLQQLDTKEARTALWEARSYTFDSPEETTEFRSALGVYLNQYRPL